MSAHVPSWVGQPTGSSVAVQIGISHRSRRVNILLAAIVVLSAADLVATIVHLRTLGMVESNPIAAFILDTTRSASALAAFKLATVAVCVALLYRLRESVHTEVAAWTAVVILSALTVWWGQYSDYATSADAVSQHLDPTLLPPDNWISLAEP